MYMVVARSIWRLGPIGWWRDGDEGETERGPGMTVTRLQTGAGRWGELVITNRKTKHAHFYTALVIFQETVIIAHRTSRLVCHFGALCAFRCDLIVTVLGQSQPGVRRSQRESGQGGGRRGNDGSLIMAEPGNIGTWCWPSSSSYINIQIRC